MELSLEPDLHPLYPNTAQLAHQLGSQSGFTPKQKSLLVSHCLCRACIFADLSVLQYLLVDSHAHPYVDLSHTDEEGIGLVSITIHGFGSDSERDVEREECVRLLIQQGASVEPDLAGWTPLHYAALHSPPTIISHLLTRGCSPFSLTKRGLTPLDIITAHTVLPGREDVAMLLDATMRGDGWTGSRLELKRKELELRLKRRNRQKDIHDDITRMLVINPRWWASADEDYSDFGSDDEGEGDNDPLLYTPPVDYSAMLVFSPDELPGILDSIITNFPPTIRNSQPANTLYLLARFASLTCDHNWLEDLLLAATDAIEETFFSRSEDVTTLVFWLYNTTVWLHLIQCDTSINEACEMLGMSELIEELVNSLFVFIIRFAERRIDQFLDNCLLEHVPLPNEFDSIQFESEWSIFRSFTSGKRKPPPRPITPSTPNTVRAAYVSPPNSPSARPPSPSSASVHSLSASTSERFSSIRQSFARGRGTSTSIQTMFDPSPSPSDITSFLTALHTLLALSDINPALIAQLWSQVMYWTSCEMFNRILTRKKYLCRSRAKQIGMNLGVLEEWMLQMKLPPALHKHFAPVRDLLDWLKCLSSITEFPNLIATIQALKNINPLQMRRAVRDYKYEVNEGRMTDECVQYLTQLEKDWERHRVKLGVEALRKELVERDRDTDSNTSATINDSMTSSSQSVHSLSLTDTSTSSNIDILFDSPIDESPWQSTPPPTVLGELLDSRHMLPLTLPSDPKNLASMPKWFPDENNPTLGTSSDSRSTSRASFRSNQSMGWCRKDKQFRELKMGTLHRLDGHYGTVPRWTLRATDDHDDEESSQDSNEGSLHSENQDETVVLETQFTRPLARKVSRKGRSSHGGEPSADDTNGGGSE